jgi:hypothetical protein
MDYKTIGGWAVAVVAGLLGVLAFLGVHLGSNASFGSITPVAQTAYNTIWYVNGLFGGSAQQFAVDASGNVTAGNLTMGKTLTLTTSNTATSTATIGCVNTYATSTATAVKFTLSSALSATTTFSGTSAGYVTWSYGSCP